MTDDSTEFLQHEGGSRKALHGGVCLDIDPLFTNILIPVIVSLLSATGRIQDLDEHGWHRLTTPQASVQ